MRHLFIAIVTTLATGCSDGAKGSGDGPLGPGDASPTDGPPAVDARADVAPDPDGAAGPDARADAAPDPDARTDAAPDPDAGPIGDDADGDGVSDDRDLCPAAPDADQTDRDGDGAGDACDPDPRRFNVRLAGGRLVLVGGFATGERHDHRGHGTSAAHTARSGGLRLTGRLLP